MTDTDRAGDNPLVDSPVAPDQNQNPLTGDVGPYTLKRLRPDVSAGDARAFFDQLNGVSEDKAISANFASLFQNTPASTLRYTKNSYFDGKNDPAETLFRSELALIIYDWVYQQGIANNITEIIKERNADDRVAGALLKIIEHCQNIASGQYITVDESQEKELNNLLSGNRFVSEIVGFIVDYIDNPPGEKEEETEGEGEQEAGGATTVASTDTPTSPTAGVPATEAGDETEGGAETADQTNQQPQQPAQPQEPQRIDVLDIKRQLFSPEIREQAARFTQISLYQLERFHGLPEGSLQNSTEIREALAQKSMTFFATALTEGRLNDLINAPELRAGFAQQFLWDVQNDFRLTAAITKHLSDVVLKNADPATRQAIEAELVKAEKGENVSELIAGLAQDPQFESILKEIQNAKPTFLAGGDEYISDISKELNQYLKDIGTHGDKMMLAQANVENIVDGLISMGMSPEILKYVDEQRFRIIFGDDIPFNSEFVQQFLPEYWEARRAGHGKKYGTLALEGESRFAISEALELLNKANELGVSAEQSDQIFNQGIAAPLNNILVSHRQLGVPVEASLAAAHSKKYSTLREQYQVYLKAEWEAMAQEQRAMILEHFGYGEATSEGVVNLSISVEFIPPQLGVLDMSAIAGNYIQGPGAFQGDGSLIPEGANVRSVLGGVQGLLGQVDRWKSFAGMAGQLGKGINGSSAEELIADIAGKAAGKAANGLPGGPLTGKAVEWLVKNALTKEGRKKLAIGGLGLGALLSQILTSLGGVIGTAIGGVIGWFTGGPAGAAIGGFLGGLGGWGIEQQVRNTLGGGGGIKIGGGEGVSLGNWGGNSGASGGGSGAGGGAVAASTLSSGAGGPLSTAMVIGSQAVLATIGIAAGGVIFTQMNINNALLADFPTQDPLSTIGIDGKQSEYVTIEKRVFITGCPGNKCEDPSFPIRAEYSIIIKPKGQYTITLQSIEDSLRVVHSEKGWEEHEGRKPPDVPERIRTITDFSDATCNGLACSPEAGQVIGPGEQFAFSYPETFDENHNHAAVLNVFELGFDYSDPSTGATGQDTAITGEVIFIGDYSQGAGCWPTDGTITQLPAGGWSHEDVDAFDIANSEGTLVYTPFGGTMCVGSVDPGYGNHLVLKEAAEGEFIFGHFKSVFISGCQEVSPGQPIGFMGTTGNSTGPHLHYERRKSPNKPSFLATLIPGGPAIRENDPVRTCYSGDLP